MSRRWLVRSAIVLLLCGAVAEAQNSASVEIGGAPAGISLEATTKDSAQKTEADVSQARPGSIVGTVLDQSGTVSVGAVVRLTSKDKSFSREAVSGDNGQFSFSNVPPGHFTLSVNSAGFGDQAFSGDLAPGQTYLVPAIVLSVATVVTTVDVKEPLDPVELATKQSKSRSSSACFGSFPISTLRIGTTPLPSLRN
jgi:hypothetical protein